MTKDKKDIGSYTRLGIPSGELPVLDSYDVPSRPEISDSQHSVPSHSSSNPIVDSVVDEDASTLVRPPSVPADKLSEIDVSYSSSSGEYGIPSARYSALRGSNLHEVTAVRVPALSSTAIRGLDSKVMSPSRIVYQHPDAIAILSKYAISVPISIRDRLEDDPDKELLFEQFKSYMDSCSDGFLSHYDSGTAHIINDKGGCSILVQAYRKDVVSQTIDDVVNDALIPKSVAIKLEYSSSKRSLQNVQLEKELQRYSAVLTGYTGAPKSGVLPILGEEDLFFSYRRPEHIEKKLRADVRNLLSSTSQIPDTKIDPLCNIVLDYRIEVLPMPLAEGVTLKEYLSQRKHTIDELVDIFSELVNIVGKLHAGDVVHRDLKPGNIFVQDWYDESHRGVGNHRRIMTILDFGISNYIGEFVDPNGTLEYVSAKQARENIVLPTHDIQALGIIFYEMIAGFNPRRSTGAKSRFVEEMLQKINEQPPMMGDDVASTRLASVIHNAVSPEGTFRTCEEFLDVIAEAVDHCVEVESIRFRQLSEQERPDYKFAFPRVYKSPNGSIMINDQPATAEMLGRVTKLTGMNLDQLMQNTPTGQAVKNYNALEREFLAKDRKIAFDYYDDELGESIDLFVKKVNIPRSLSVARSVVGDVHRAQSDEGIVSDRVIPKRSAGSPDSVSYVDPSAWFTDDEMATPSQVGGFLAQGEQESFENYFNEGGLENDVADANPDLAKILEDFPFLSKNKKKIRKK